MQGALPGICGSVFPVLLEIQQLLDAVVLLFFFANLDVCDFAIMNRACVHRFARARVGENRNGAVWEFLGKGPWSVWVCDKHLPVFVLVSYMIMEPLYLLLPCSCSWQTRFL